MKSRLRNQFIHITRTNSRIPHISRNLSSNSIQQSQKYQEFSKRLQEENFSLQDFLQTNISLSNKVVEGGKSVYVETYGCQMNVSDSEIVQSILCNNGYSLSSSLEESDIILVNTCAIRDKAEKRVWDRLKYLRSLKRSHTQTQEEKKKNQQRVVGILGCMAERLKKELLEEKNLVDLVVGPDAYRSLPDLLREVDSGQQAMNVQLSLEETYADIAPVRKDVNGVSAFVSIMRGCNNMCSFCIVPYTRGRERSRPVDSILKEVENLSKQGVKEIVLLGQNVNSYNDLSTPSEQIYTQPIGFKSVCKIKEGGTRFAQLLDLVSKVDENMRIRFTSPHPKDFPLELLQLMKERNNICNSIHVPVQSGSSTVLERMGRGYTREAYLSLIDTIKQEIPDVSLSTDLMTGFCGETEEDHQDTLSLIETVDYDHAFMFAYSLREKTRAHRRYKDDVEEKIKLRRLQEIVNLFYKTVRNKNENKIGTECAVLVDGPTRKDTSYLGGRSDGNVTVVFPDKPLQLRGKQQEEKVKSGDYVKVLVQETTGKTLKGVGLYKTGLINEI